MGVEYNLISKEAQRALEEFAQDFAAAFLQPGIEQWAQDLGIYRKSRALKTTFPIPLSAAGYKKFEGNIKYRGLFQKSLELIPETWQDGVAEFASVVEAPDFIGWGAEPEAIAAAGAAVLNTLIAEQLAANPTCWTKKTFFANDHPINVVKTGLGAFDNLFAGAGTSPTAANLKAAKAAFRKIKGANGLPLGLRMTHVLAPSAQEELWKDLLEQDMVIQAVGSTFGAVDNRHKGTVKPIFSDELTSDLKWYPLALNKPGMRPWVAQDDGAPEEIRSDKTSPLYKDQLKIGVAYVRRCNAALALPHCIQEWEGAA